jgi:hypothetical protein
VDVVRGQVGTAGLCGRRAAERQQHAADATGRLQASQGLLSGRVLAKREAEKYRVIAKEKGLTNNICELNNLGEPGAKPPIFSELFNN